MTMVMEAKGQATLHEDKYSLAQKSCNQPFRASRPPPQPSQHSDIPLSVCRLSSKDQCQCCEAGICFNCEEQYHHGHVCKHPTQASSTT